MQNIYLFPRQVIFLKKSQQVSTLCTIWVLTFLYVNRYSRIEVPNKVTVREVWAEINGTIEGMDVIAIENEGELYIWSYANTAGYKAGEIVATNISVRAGGKFEPLTAVEQMQLYVTRLIVNGNGYVRTNNLRLNATNVTIDLSGNVQKFYSYPITLCVCVCLCFLCPWIK